MPAEKFISEAENRFVREKVDHTLKTVRNACRQPIPLSSYRSVAPIYDNLCTLYAKKKDGLNEKRLEDRRKVAR